ncbi:MAG: phage head closure protein [Bacteroidales bacterium]|nr:phage head closure protein [Bacteroidales bacterium]
MFDSIITLKKETNTVNEYGDTVQTFTERTVFAEVKSISQSEFYQAQATGLKPEIKFVIADFVDYQGEKILSYKPFGASAAEDYTVLRTYRNKINLEIVCKRGIE